MARVYVERRELPAELLRLLDAHPVAAECTPPLDIIETEDGIEAVLDVPGVSRSSIEIMFSRNVLLVAGQKLPAVCEHVDAAFHIAAETKVLLAGNGVDLGAPQETKTRAALVALTAEGTGHGGEAVP